ncbi:MAG: hypothetical protein HY721_26865 [Planctomycetes bacterium]|nr:hypothetical protein [Planctomycetota bacterium]
MNGRGGSRRLRSALPVLAFVAVAALVSGAPCLPAQEAGQRAAPEASPGAPTDFLRFVETGKGEGRLETNSVTYVRPDGAEVALIAAVHVADAAYYGRLQRDFERYDQLLYEMVKPKDADPAKAGRSDNLLSAFQRGLKDMLGLEFQLDGIDYSRKNFVHADLDPETFFRMQREKGESILTLMFKAFLKGLEEGASGRKPASGLDIVLAFASKDSKRRLKLIFARELEGMERILAGFEEGTEGGSVIVVERNKAALKVLRAGIEAGKKRFGIFYGAGHMPDLEKRLVEELGFKKSREEWVTAWDIRRAERSGERPAPAEAEGPVRAF